MDPILILFVSLFCLTYFEGLLFALCLAKFKKFSAIGQLITTFLWPFAIPYIGYKAYKEYEPLIREFQTNPMLQALMGLNTQTQTQDTEEVDSN